MPETEDSYGGYVRMPQYKPPPRYFSDRNENDMYPFTHLGFNVSDVHERYNGIKGPLTLFAPFPHEDDKDDREVHEDADPHQDAMELDRPVTPINEEIKKPPKTFNKLAKLVRRRISAKPEVEHLNVEDQQALAAIIMGELNGIWSNFRLQVADPFLSPEDNRELQRRITVHIVTACEQLFNHYINKAQILNKRGVFSGPANMSRLKAQLTLDANKFLNVLTVRRYIAEDLRRAERDLESPTAGRPITGPAGPAKGPAAMTHRNLIDASRPKSQQRKNRRAVRGGDVREIQARMPKLDTSKLLEVIADLPERRSQSRESEMDSVPTKDDTRNLAFQRRTSADVTKEKVLRKRSNSVPQLDLENLLEELGVEEVEPTSTRSLTTLRKNAPEGKPITQRSLQDEEEDAKPEPPAVGSRQYAADDLRRLVARARDDDDLGDEEDLPPLIQALTRNAKHDGKGELLRNQLLELEERERQRRLAEVITIDGPSHPQPATVPAKMGNNLVVRASDIRVSERVCLSSITLQKNATVYNDLIDEIDPLTVKRLDSNLFLGDEITEVYHEIMKTVPTDHLLLENDPLVEPTAEGVNIMAALASSTLNRRRDERIINPSLHHESDPPWGELDMADWAKGGSPPKGMSNVTTLALDELEEGGPKKKPPKPSGGGPPGTAGTEDAGMGEFMARSYASWLLWWKNTINSDDYMKYLSTQETDYMGVVFHFYNSDDEDEDEESSPSGGIRPAAKHEEERTRKVEELRAQKSEFTEGLWNVNSVMLGGLGKDPLLEEDEQKSRTKSPVSDMAASTKAINTKTKVVSRRQVRELQQIADEEKLRETVRTRMSLRTVLSHTQTENSQKKGKNRGADKAEGPSPQDRLEKVWNKLSMPDNLRLDMAIKYSSDDYHSHLDTAMEMWETATDLIIKREELIAKLENFERLASDPNRFFEKGHRGSSVARLEEAKIRSGIYRRIDAIDVELKKLLENIQEEFSDEITFHGRPYLEKMKWDRTEMLYWLQEERKQQAIDLEARLNHLPQLPLNMVQLQPLATT